MLSCSCCKAVIRSLSWASLLVGFMVCLLGILKLLFVAVSGLLLGVFLLGAGGKHPLRERLLQGVVWGDPVAVTMIAIV